MFTSYAQNFEDVMLWRALKHVENGFYIDIGAQDPIVDSVSRGFYEIGWRGISVEPSSKYAEKLKADRIDEEVEECAVGTGAEVIRFFEFPNTGLGTGDENIAKSHEDRGFRAEVTTVKLVPLCEILDRHQNRDIHWLKIDVEGMERSVLESWGDSPKRPWIVVVESTVPLTSARSQASWEPLLMQRGYQRCYFDGLNSYYVSEQKSELKAAFELPPNVFDEFTLSGTSTSPMTAAIAENLRMTMQELQVTRHELQMTRSELQTHKNTVQYLTSNFQIAVREMESSKENLMKIYASSSWRLTGPLRAVKLVASNPIAIAGRLQRFLRRANRSAIGLLIFLVRKYPRFRALAVRIMQRHHRLLSPLVSIMRSQSLPRSPRSMAAPTICDTTRYPVRSFDMTSEDDLGLSREARLVSSRLSLTIRRNGK